MGLFNFINRKREQWNTKKLEVIDEDIANNLAFFSQGLISAAQCIAALAYCTEKQISIINNISAGTEEIRKYLICFYIIFFEEFLDGYDPYPDKSKLFAQWVAKYVYEKDNDLKEKSFEKYEKSLSQHFKEIYNYGNVTSKKALISSVSVEIFRTYPFNSKNRASENRERISDIITINAGNLEVILEKSDNSNLLPDVHELYKDGVHVKNWEFML